MKHVALVLFSIVIVIGAYGLGFFKGLEYSIRKFSKKETRGRKKKI